MERSATVSATVQRLLRTIPRSRHVLSCFRFRVEPPVDEPLEIELWAEDFEAAAGRAVHLATQAYGSGTTVAATEPTPGSPPDHRGHAPDPT